MSSFGRGYSQDVGRAFGMPGHLVSSSGPYEVPEVEPGAGWTGTAGSGFSSPPSDPTRTTAKPAMQLLVAPNQYFTDTLLVGVIALANNNGTMLENLGLEEVRLYFESDTPTIISQPTVETYEDVNGNTQSCVGWWAYLKKPTGTSGHANVYFEAVPSDGTMNNRVLGPIQFSPQNTLHDIEYIIDPSLPNDTSIRRFYDFDQMFFWLFANPAQPKGNNPRVTVVGPHASGVHTLNAWIGPYTPQGYMTIEANVPVVFGRTAAAGINLMRPRWDGIRFKGENITIDQRYVSQLYHEGSARKHWIDGAKMTDSGGRYYLVDKGQRPQVGLRNGGIYTDCDIEAIQDPCNASPLIRNATIHDGCRDVMSDAACCMNATVYNWSSKEWRTLVDALTVEYVGSAGTATLSLSGSNEANNRVFTAKEDGVSVGTFTVVNNNPAGNYEVQDVADWLNGLTDWSATVVDNSRRASALGAPGTYGPFTDLDVKTSAKTLDTFFDQHADMAQFITRNQNAIFWGLVGWNLSTQNIYPGTPSGIKDFAYINCCFEMDGTDPDTAALFSQLSSAHSHVVVAHCSLADQSLSLRADFVDWRFYNPDGYCLVANNALAGSSWTGTPDADLTIDSNVTDAFAVHDTAPAGATNHSYGGNAASKFVDASNGDFNPAGELLLVANLKTPVVRFDADGTDRGTAATAAGAYAA